ncbi:MAG: helix-turn-helix transcriptional regulator [Candidatus Gastranaerophilales bacterium]|nr:helix-turn-helix transcriptional regulator [Candidatus Gastranaerophilales bacterium]
MTTQGKRLKVIREKLKLTQEELGKKLGISKQYYSNIETDRTLLNNEKLVLLFKYYNINLNYLLAGEGCIFNDKEENSKFDTRVRQILREEGLIK